MAAPPVVTSLSEACAWALETFRAHPERDAERASRLAYAGEARPYPVLYLGMWQRPDDDSAAPPEFELPRLAVSDPEEAALAARVVQLLAPLALDNPLSLALGTGVGPGTLAASFGARLNAECGYAPEGELTLEQALAQPEPDLASGLLPGIRREIELWKKVLPPEFRIAPPDVQGPFNLAHAVLGGNVFLAPYDEPEKFHELMRRIVRHYVEVQQAVRAWIGEERLPGRRAGLGYLAECSVNLVSPEFYLEFLREHDYAAATALERIHLHPCSGPHVFRLAWRELPGIASIEAGSMEHRMAAGAIQVDEALALIGDRPVVLEIGQELPKGREFEFVARDLDRYAGNRRLLFGYTGTHWLRRDRERIRELHRRLDDYWASRYGF